MLYVFSFQQVERKPSLTCWQECQIRICERAQKKCCLDSGQWPIDSPECDLCFTLIILQWLLQSWGQLLLVGLERQWFPLWVVVWFYSSSPKWTVLKCLTYLWIFIARNLANGLWFCILDNEEFYDLFLQIVLNLDKVLQSWYWQWGNKSGKSTLSLSHQQLVVNTSNTTPTPASFFLNFAIASSRIVNTRLFLTQFIIVCALNFAIGSVKKQQHSFLNLLLSYNIVRAEQSHRIAVQAWS